MKTIFTSKETLPEVVKAIKVFYWPAKFDV